MQMHRNIVLDDTAFDAPVKPEPPTHKKAVVATLSNPIVEVKPEPIPVDIKDPKISPEYPWRKYIHLNLFLGSCGCTFDREGYRVTWCGDHY